MFLFLTFSNASLAMSGSCAEVAKSAERLASSWGRDALRGFASRAGSCAIAEFIIAPEAPRAGVSVHHGSVSFPWGCGAVPLPDGPSLYALSNEGRGVAVIVMGEVLDRVREYL